MDTLGITLLIAAISAVITGTIGIVLKRQFAVYFKQRDEKEAEEKAKAEKLAKLEAEQRRRQRNDDIMMVLKTELEPINDSLETLKRGTQAGLRHDLYQIYDEWEDKGYCPREVKADFENLYNSYHALGKNGVMDNCHNKLMDLPDNKPAQIKKKVLINE